MIDLVRNLITKKTATARKDSGNEESDRIRVAVCALFLEMANTDGEFSQTERQSVISLLKGRYALSDNYVAELIHASQEQLDGSIDLWQFSNLINKNYSQGEKIQIIEMLWQIVYADGKLDKHEDYMIHKLAKLLRLTHKHLIDAKLRVLRNCHV